MPASFDACARSAICGMTAGLRQLPSHREVTMLGISGFGMVHTLISLVAVIAGAVSLIRYGAISSRTPAGRIYLSWTVLTCLTGFFIFHHGGFGKPHALGIITLVVI